ncbi:erythromycin esterase family protein [Spirosoma validum]|uniref:Erythromycin esterase family protein n=1 Tax=Spirosoma validum TaxID=2771355 RepID=A0A927AYX4_9BACT|nr:erythromycin esterase family protein [Spirosoma validum]MBD2752338.1 erythromycin esterase family protein [Spirosoma validum]
MRLLFFLLALSTISPAQSIQRESQPLEQGKPIGRDLKVAQTHAYTINLSKGQFLGATVNQQGIDVLIRIFGPGGGKVAEIDSPNGDQGDEPIALEAKAAGTYRIEVSSLEKDATPGRYGISVDEILSAQVYAARVAEKLRKQKAVIGWLKTNAIPLKTVEAGNDVLDLQPLKQTLKDVRYVGLGEATHGTREFFQVKHRLLEFLVREMDFRVFAIEGSYAALQNINDYVMGKTDDGTKALDSQGFWTWNTEEVRAMMDWARQYNAGVSEAKRVKFVGFDIQFNQSGKDKLLDYLKRVAPERFDSTTAFFRTNLDSLNSALSTPDQQKNMQTTLKNLQNNYNDLFIFLELNGPALVAKSSQAEYEQMREYARVLMQYLDSYSRQTSAGVSARDVYMADNFRRLVDREPAGTRFVIWAHNGHIATDNNGFFMPTGAYLRQLYGNAYYAFGFSFNQGSFQAREAQPKDPLKRMLMAFTTNPAPEGTIDWYLAQTGPKTFIVDFRSPSKNADINAWLTTSQLMRSIGSVYASGAEQNFFQPTTLSQRYDGLLFIDTTTRARPNPSVKNVLGSTTK